MKNILQAVYKIATDDKYPELGCTDRVYPVHLSEAEINSIYAAFGFCKGASILNPGKSWFNHYGKTLEQLTNRLSEEFDDK